MLGIPNVAGPNITEFSLLGKAELETLDFTNFLNILLMLRKCFKVQVSRVNCYLPICIFMKQTISLSSTHLLMKFECSKDVTRDVMKEMRRLREIRHDNVNSFIGASVEPMRILVITDYCSKGSLYVSHSLSLSLSLLYCCYLRHFSVLALKLSKYNSLLVVNS